MPYLSIKLHLWWCIWVISRNSNIDHKVTSLVGRSRGAIQMTHEEKIKNMCDMGFPREMVVKALESNNWDETVALNSLLEG
mmetsp:Transcript_22678/g.22398  ORF Transcript_22678/g.22398 Transcript_22678/m.22398 type:complete len:81 (-) Transcript_22678:75-317(-)